MKTLNFLFIFLILASLGMAAPPLTEQTTKGLVITTAHPDFLSSKSEWELYFHVFNSSYFQFNNTEIDCTIHVYNQTNGVHLVEAAVGKHLIYDFEYKPNSSDKPKFVNGYYHYIIYCYPGTTAQQERGYVRNQFMLTTIGDISPYDGMMLTAIWIMLPLLIGIIMLAWILRLGDEHVILKIAGSIFVSLCGLISIGISMMAVEKYFNWIALEQLISTGFWVYALIFFVLVSYWAIYLIRKAFDSAKKAKMERLQY